MRALKLFACLGLTLIAQLLLAPTAFAQCEGTWDNARISRNLDEVGTALVEADLAKAKKTLTEVDKGLGCIEELIDPKVLSRHARSIGVLRFYEQDEPQAIKWGILGRVLDPNGTWPGDLPDGHPYLEVLAEEEDPTEKSRAEGFWVPPEKGSVFVNGEFSPEPEAYPELPELVQLFDKVGYPIDTFWQDGIGFRDGLTSAEGGPVEVPKYYNPETGEVKGAKRPAKVKGEKLPIEKAPIDFPVIPVATAGGLAAVSGLTYALAGAAAGSMPNATTEAELTKARSTTNILVLVSALTGAGAIGVGIGTVLVDADGVVSWNVKF